MFTVQIRSDTGIAFNKKPEMKAKEIAETGVEALKSGQYHQVPRPLLACRVGLLSSSRHLLRLPNLAGREGFSRLLQLDCSCRACTGT